MENNNYNPNENVENEATQNIEQPPVSTPEDVTSQPEVQQIYTYTSDSNYVTINNEIPQNPQYNEPTQTFQAVEKEDSNSTGSGLKVFFTIIAVMVALVIAISAGYVFGNQGGGTPSFHFNSSTPLADKGDAQFSDKSAVFNAVDPSVVSITVYNNSGKGGTASGVIYSDDGYIVTNDHLYAEIPSAKFLVTLNDGTEYEAKFVAGDTRSDLAIIKIDAVDLVEAQFGNSEQVVIGEEVIAIGYPSGASGKSILTAGTISSNNIRFTGTSSYSVKMIQTDTAINPGNSGGALVNMYGQVIGIPSIKMAGTQYDNVSYAIPSNTVVKVADSLIEHGYVVGRGRLGIQYTEIDGVTAKLNNIPKGLMIQEITVESELYGKGIAVGDIITHINDVEITRRAVALDIMESTEPGKVMTFTVYSAADGSTKNYYAALIEDRGNSSYTNTVTEDNLDLEDFFSGN